MTIEKTALLLLTASCLVAQEPGGPAILSRGTGVRRAQPGQTLQFRPYLSVSGIYDSALTAVSIDPSGQLPNISSYGVEVGIGAYAYHDWKKSVLGLDYRGDLRHYTRNSYYDGSNHRLTLGLSRQATKHVTLSLRESAGTYSRSYGGLNAAGFYDLNSIDTPRNELFDGRVYYLNTLGDVTYQKSARLSFNMGGDVYVVRRQSSALVGVTAKAARGDVAYRATRRTTVGADYRFTHFAFTRGFGGSDIHTIALNYSTRLSRVWQLRLHAGGSRVESLGLRRVEIDPVVVAIIGQTSGIEVDYRVNYVPDLRAELRGEFRRSSLVFAYSRAITSGNGVYLTSLDENGEANYSYTGIRKWNFGVSGGYGSLHGLTQTIGKYRNYHGGVGVTRSLVGDLHGVVRFDTRRYEVTFTQFKRNQYRASIGFAYSPGDIPLSLW